MIKMENKISFNKENNKLVVPLTLCEDEKSEAIYLSPVMVRQALPQPASPEDKIEELNQIIHEIHKDRLVNIREYIKELNRLSKGEEEARNELKTCKYADVKRWAEIAKTWMNQKNILREIRYAIKLLDEEERYVRELIAKAETGL